MATKKISVSDETPQGEFIGYARVSTAEQNLDMQTAALKKVGCYNIYEEKVSAFSSKRYQLEFALKDLRPGDTLVVWRLDRLARSIRDLLARLKQIEDAGAKFRSLTESFDTATAGGRLLLHVIAAMAEFERDLTVERTQAGLKRARERGMVLGAKIKVTDAMKAKITADLGRTGKRAMRVADIAAKYGIAASTIYTLFPGGKYKIINGKAART